MAMKKGPKLFLVAAGILAVPFGLHLAMQKGLIKTPGIMKAIVASRVVLPPQSEAQVQNVKAFQFPSATKSDIQAVPIKFDIWEWNAMSALIYANGGPDTTRGSLMEKYNVNLNLHREDSNTQMKADLLTCAKQLHDGEKTCSTGAAAIVVMGDGGGQWLADLNPQLKKLGPEYQAIIIGAVGRSNGEDALLGPAEWKANPQNKNWGPQNMKGKTIVGVIRDGDWGIALNYEGANGLKNNRDLKTYDPDAVNWISAPDEDYIKAVTEVFVPNRCEDRKVVKDGIPTGEVKNICPDGVVTWFPGDELAIHGRPGTTKIISTFEYKSQMPSVIIGIKKFFNDNRDEFAGLLAATFQAADQHKAFEKVRKAAGDISAKVYNDQTGDYWYKAFSGYIDPVSKQPVGGSAVFNLEDNINFFGLDGKHNNNMRATYEQFGKIATMNYPELFKDNPVPPYAQAVDTSFILGAQSLLNSNDIQGGEAERVDYGAQARSGEVRGHKAVYIQFATNKDEISPDSIPALIDLKDQLAINSGLAIKIDGYTDNSGSDAVNIPLSAARARSVKRFFQKAAPMSFPESRFAGVNGHGSQDPIASNATPSGKAANRRVEISQIGQ